MQMGPILRITHRSTAEAANAVSALADTEPAAPATSIAGPGAPTASRCTTSAARAASQSGQTGRVHLTGRAGPHVHVLATGRLGGKYMVPSTSVFEGQFSS